MFIKNALADRANNGHTQMAGAIHIHPNGRFVTMTNRNSGTEEIGGRKVFKGGENNVATFSIDPATGEPTLIQNIEAQTIHLRTFAIDPSGRLLIAASILPMAMRDGSTMPAALVALSHRRRRQAHLRAQIRRRHRPLHAVLDRHRHAALARRDCRIRWRHPRKHAWLRPLREECHEKNRASPPPCCVCVAGLARAQDYPNAPIHLISGFPAGSTADISARVVGAKMGQILGQQVVIENRLGAASSIAGAQAARAAKDGYTRRGPDRSRQRPAGRGSGPVTRRRARNVGRPAGKPLIRWIGAFG